MTQNEKDFLVWVRDSFGYHKGVGQHVVSQEVFSRFAAFIKQVRVEEPTSEQT